MKHHFWKIPLIATLCLSFLKSQAQTLPDTTSKEADLFEMSLSELVNMRVTTASRKAEKISHAPATMHVITSEQIRARGYVYLKDALRDLPGMETIENYFSEMGTLIPVRGVVGNNKIIVLLNGIRMNPAGGEEMSFKSDFNIQTAKQIEVMYGPASTLYGQDAISGVINVITETPSDKAALNISMRTGAFGNKEGMVSFAKKITPQTGISSYLSLKNSSMSDLSRFHKDYFSPYRESALQLKVPTIPVRWDNGVNAHLKIESGNSSISFFHRESSRSSAEGGYIPILQFVPEAILKDRNTMIAAENRTEFSSKVNLESAISYSPLILPPAFTCTAIL